MKALAIHVTGIVQGVGFRPFVHNLAIRHGLNGWVLNASDGVHCLVQGDSETVDAFPDALRAGAPAMAVIEHLITEEVELESTSGFEIRESHTTDGAMTLVSPDIATCPECVTELMDPADRRSGYPFVNCTNCGPRFTIIDDVPYDRPLTTMRDFEMCPECAAEYADPADRRFHAQPDACFVCGPRLYLMNSPAVRDTGEPTLPGDWAWASDLEVSPRPHRDREVEAERSAAIIDATARLIADGAILAIKGLGGFHLACDATDAKAVAALRERKHRWGKPLAIMVPDLATAQEYCEIGPEEIALLTGAIRPVVLLRRTPTPGSASRPLADGVADGLAEIGVMLPYTPLHHLLLAATGGPLVMTSGNRSDEPIATDNREALERLRDIADAFLLHDRDIHARYDDSVTRVVGDIVEPVRRARGYAPFPLPLPFDSDIDILAAGPEQKNTFTLLTGRHAFVSQHIGDLENSETLESFERTVELYRRLFRIEPGIVAHDLHPEYLSTKWALGLDLPKIGVQHHHAHIVSVTAEHGTDAPVAGIAFDGTGYGEDGRIWGGEALISTWSGYERVAHLRYMPMPGGAGAIRHPARMALGALSEFDLLEHPGASPLRARVGETDERTVVTMATRRVNSPLTSSMGRLFDAVAAMIGVADEARYEGEAAILLEAACDHGATGTYDFVLTDRGPGSPLVIDSAPVLERVLEDVAQGIPQGVIAMRFHRAVVGCIVTVGAEVAARAGTRSVALAGGVFMNRLILGGAVAHLTAAGYQPLTHARLPVNDGAISYGQAVVAWARRNEV